MNLLILLRHGNTFGPSDKVVMVGANENPPLTDVGEEQALLVGEALRKVGQPPALVLCGPLRRTSRYAEILCGEIDPTISWHIDERLRELDFGPWSGLTNEEITERFSADDLQAWNDEGRWPQSVSFEPSEDTVRSQTEALLAQCSVQLGLKIIVTSNGRLRMFGRVAQASQANEFHGFKMRTGGASVLKWEDGGWHILGWNLHAEGLAETLRRIATASQ